MLNENEKKVLTKMKDEEYYLMVETMLSCVKSVFTMGKDQKNIEVCDMLIEETRNRFDKAYKKE